MFCNDESLVYNLCVGENNCRLPRRTLQATTSTLMGLLFTCYAPTTGGCTIGNATNHVVYAWLNFWYFYQWCKAVFVLSLPRSMNGTQRTSFAASAISRSHTCALLPVRPYEATVYWKRFNTRDELWYLTQAAATTLWHMPGIFQRTRNSLRHRARLCI
jgi:hypothetical protein